MTSGALDISVVICAYTEKRWDDLVAAVASVQRQRVPAREIIVVIDHNPALLERVRAQLAGVTTAENQQEQGLSGARNTGASIARGAIVAFLDDDAEAGPDWLASLQVCYADDHVVGVGGKIDPWWLSGRPSWFPAEFNWVVGCSYRGMPADTAPVRNVIGANMSMRREVITEAGGFRSGFGCSHSKVDKRPALLRLQPRAGDEETEFCIRTAQQRPGAIWLYAPQAQIRHRVPAQRARWRYFLWRCYDEGLGKAMLVKMLGAQDGLSSERSYTMKTLPMGVARGLVQAATLRNVGGGVGQATAIVLGLSMTVAGYTVGRVLAPAAR